MEEYLNKTFPAQIPVEIKPISDLIKAGNQEDMLAIHLLEIILFCGKEACRLKKDPHEIYASFENEDKFCEKFKIAKDVLHPVWIRVYPEPQAPMTKLVQRNTLTIKF